MHVSAQLAEDMQSFLSSGLKDTQITRLKHCILDWSGVALAGTSEEITKRTVAYVRRHLPGTSSSLLCGGNASLQGATLANTISGHALDYDDTHLGYWGHPSATVVPVALALAEKYPCTGLELLTAIAAGFEASCRIGLMLGMSHRNAGWHMTATAGSFGAAATTAAMIGLASDRWADAFGFCAVQASGLINAFGSDAKAYQVGKAASQGQEAALLAQCGLRSPMDILDQREGFARAYAAEHSTLPRPDGDVTDGVLFKYHPSCFGTQAPAEAARRLRAEIGDSWNEISTINITMPPSFVAICNKSQPTTLADARFSVKTIVALELMGRSLFDKDVLSVLDNHALVRKTSVFSEEGLCESAAGVTLQTGNATYVETIDLSAPPDFIEERSRLAKKFVRLSHTILGNDGAEVLLQFILAIEGVDDVSGLMGLLKVNSRH